MSKSTIFGWFKNHPILSSTLFIILFALLSNSFSQPQYYNYNTTSGGNAFPFGVAAGKVIQWIYLPGEINQPTPVPSGNITKVYFTLATGSGTYTNLTIKMGLTTETTLPTGGFYTGQLDTVYFNPSVVLTSTAGTFTSITLNTPFVYDNTKSLVIEVNQCTAVITGSMSIYNTTLTGMRRTYNQTAGGCNYIYQGQGGQLANLGIDIATAPPVCSFMCTSQTSGTTNILQAVSTVNNKVCWIAGGAATVRRTVNGGTTWTNANPNTGVITGDIYSMFATDSNTCLLTTSPTATFVYRTTNGGTNWTQVFTQAGGFIDAIVMTSASTGYMYGDPVGARWSLWKTTNGGVNWDSAGMYLPQAASEAGYNNAMKIIGTNMWIGTGNTRVYHSTNLGLNWTFAATGDANSYCLHFQDANTGLVGGGVMNKTTNGGTSYSTITAPGTGSIYGLSGGTGNLYWFVRGVNVYKTEDAGANWTTAFTGVTGNTLYGVDMLPVNGCPRGWAVGANGTVIKIGNDTLVAVGNNNNQVPNVYTLSQNYPNPFNPSTTISFSLPLSGMTTLVVYDLLGREITTLVNDIKPSGNYSVSFDGNNLSSGVYFYTLKSGDFVESKKMLLIK